MATTNTELYRRIMDRMSDDPEVVALCRSFVERADAQAARTQGRFAQVRAFLSSLGDEELASAEEVASAISTPKDDWTTRRASWYLARLVRDGEAEAVDGSKSAPKRYRLSTLA